MKKLLFTDSSVSSKVNLAVCGFIALEHDDLQHFLDLEASEISKILSNKIHFQSLHSHKSTFAEIKTVILALQWISRESRSSRFDIFTDCQSLCDLINGRLKKLAANNYISKSGKILGNAELYKELSSLIEGLELTVTKIKGHSKTRVSVEEKIFSCLDRAVRQKLRDDISSLGSMNPQ